MERSTQINRREFITGLVGSIILTSCPFISYADRVDVEMKKQGFKFVARTPNKEKKIKVYRRGDLFVNTAEYYRPRETQFGLIKWEFDWQRPGQETTTAVVPVGTDPVPLMKFMWGKNGSTTLR